MIKLENSSIGIGIIPRNTDILAMMHYTVKYYEGKSVEGISVGKSSHFRGLTHYTLAVLLNKEWYHFCSICLKEMRL